MTKVFAYSKVIFVRGVKPIIIRVLLLLPTPKELGSNTGSGNFYIYSIGSPWSSLVD